MPVCGDQRQQMLALIIPEPLQVQERDKDEKPEDIVFPPEQQALYEQNRCSRRLNPAIFCLFPGR